MNNKQNKSNKPNAMFVMDGKLYKVVREHVEEPTLSRIVKRYTAQSINYATSLNQDRTYTIAIGVK